MRKKLYTKSWVTSMVSSNATIRHALQAISKSGSMMACVTDEHKNLLAILTDSDIRRAILHGAKLDDSIAEWQNCKPVTASVELNADVLMNLAISKCVREIPLLDHEGHLADIFVVGRHGAQSSSDPSTITKLENPMFVLAGGLGSRLRSVVNDRPKPLAVVGGKPILETLLMQAYAAGFYKFYISVNYLSEQIEEHLAGEQYKDFQITVVKEPKKLGTAGSLSLIADEIKQPVIVCNGDVLTKLPFDRLVHLHERRGSDLTCTVRPYYVSIPYGVFEMSDAAICGIQEKPDVQYLVNAGIYVVSADLCQTLPRGEYCDMPELVSKALKANQKVGAYLLHEYWIDIGRPEEFKRANEEFHLHFADLHKNKLTY
jgi:dTDP-glucose pyrophosphorylase